MLLYSLANFWQSTYRRNPSVVINFLISLALNILMWVFLIIKIQPYAYLSEFGTIPLHYNVYFGIDLFGKWYSVFFMPLVGLLVILANNIIGYQLFVKERLLSLFLSYFQSIVNLILFAAALFVVLLNI